MLLGCARLSERAHMLPGGISGRLATATATEDPG